MSHRLVESSSDIVVEANAPDLGQALVEVARAFTEVTLAQGTALDRRAEAIDVESRGDLPLLAVRFVNQLVYLLNTRGFLPRGGEVRVSHERGLWRATGELRGDTLDPKRHSVGSEVKAATLHEAVCQEDAQGARVRLLLDL